MGEPSAAPRVVEESVNVNGKPLFRFSDGEVHLYNDEHQDKVRYPFDWHRSALATITERRENMKLSWFKRWLTGVLCIRPDPWRMSAIAAAKTRWPTPTLSNFADWYRHLRQERGDDEHAEYVATMREVIEGFVGMRLEDAGDRRRKSRCE